MHSQHTKHNILDSLDLQTRRKLIEALKLAYPYHSDLRRMLRVQMGLDLADIAGPGDDWQGSVLKLVEWAEQRGALADLVNAARDGSPENRALCDFIDEVWSQDLIRIAHLRRQGESVCGVAPARSSLDDVRAAFGCPDREESISPTLLTVEYTAKGVTVGCCLSPQRGWIVDWIRIMAPFAEGLTFSKLYPGMPLSELQRTCAGKYRPSSNGRHGIVVLEPLYDSMCPITITSDAQKISMILMLRRS